MADAHKNFAYSLVATAPSPATSGTSLVVTAAQGTFFPTVPFNATVWPVSAQPTSSNAEIVRVTAISTDTLTITRAQEGTRARTIVVGDQIAATITAKTLTDTENILVKWAPFLLASSGHSFQSLASDYTGQTGTGSVYVFPITVPENIVFNMVIVPNSISYVTTAIGAASNSYYSQFGLYSMTGNTLSLMSSNSFSIGETVNSVSLSWNFPTTTQTSGYGYGGFAANNASLTTTAQMVSYISGTRAVGLQFGGNMSLSDGIYWMGLMSMRSKGDSRSTHGLSLVGIIGNPIATINQAGTAAGLLPIGSASSAWSGTGNSHSTQWFGRHIAGFVTATSLANQGGTAIPSSIALSALGAGAAAQTVTILPAVTFVSTGI